MNYISLAVQNCWEGGERESLNNSNEQLTLHAARSMFTFGACCSLNIANDALNS